MAPTETITVNYPKEMHNVLVNPTVLVKLEQQSKAIVMFSPGQRGELRVLGCDTLSVTLALSAIEDLINIYLQEQTSDSGTAAFQSPSHRAKKRLNKELRRFSLDDSIIIISEEEFTYMNNAVKRTILGWLQENQDPQTPRRTANTRPGGVPDSPDVIVVDTDLDDTIVQQCPDVSLSAMLQDSFHTPVNSPGGGSSTCVKPPQPCTGAVHSTGTETDPPCEPRNLLTCLPEEKDSLHDEPSKTRGHVPTVESPQKTQSGPLTRSAQPPPKRLSGPNIQSARSPLKVLNGPRTQSAQLSHKALSGAGIQSWKNATEDSTDDLKGSKRQKLSQQACEKQRSSQEKSNLDKSDDVIPAKKTQKPAAARSEQLKNNSAQLDSLSQGCTAQQNMLVLSSMADRDRNTLGTERNLKRTATQLDDNSPAVLETSATLVPQHNSIAANMKSTTHSDIGFKLIASVQPDVAASVQLNVTTSVQSKVATSVQSKVTTSVQSKVATYVQSKVATSVQSKVATSVQSKVATSVQSKVTTSVQSKVAAPVQSKVATYVLSKVASSVQSKVATAVQPKVATSVQPKLTASVQPKVGASVQPKVAASIQPKVAVCNQIKEAAPNQTGVEKLELVPSSVPIPQPLLKQQSASEKSRLRYIVIDGSNLAMA